MYFLENLVRIHRAGEGAPFTGLKPAGVPIEEKVAAADKCIEIGNLSPLEGLASPEEMSELEKRLQKALTLKDFDLNDVQAGREYIKAYVSFFKFAEGEDHDHGHGHDHEDGSSYPNQLTSNELSTLSKIVIVADVISAMFEDRPYRKRLNKQAVISELINGRDTLCDSNSVDVVFQSDLLMPLCRCQMIIR